LTFTTCQSSPQKKKQVETIKPLPPVETATSLFIDNITDFQALIERQKGKVTLVNLWATWCKPCVYEMPALEKLEQNYRKKGVKIIALSLDDIAKADSLVPPYWKKHQFSMDYYVLGTKDPSTIINKIDPLWMGVIPTSYIFNTQGEKVETITGTLNYQGFERKVLAVLNAN